jgi:hypothetical protein
MAVTEDVDWTDLVAAILDESQVRGARWLLRDMPWLEGPVSDQDRLQLTFRGRITSLRLIMFQSYFLNFVARPCGESLSDALSRYNCQFGQPTEPQKDCLVQACRGILNVKSWSEFYGALGLEAPSDRELANQLCEAMQRSRQCGYHGPTLLQIGKQGMPEKVGVQKCLQRAFADMEHQKRMAELQMLRQKEIERQEQKVAGKVRVSRGRFAALDDSDDD